MGQDLYRRYPRAKELFDTADRFLDFSLSDLCFCGPEEDLNKDVNAQLAVYTVSCIMTDIFRSEGITPDAVSGYSAGFYGAAYAAGCFDFQTGLHTVYTAGQILLDEGKKSDGAMAVIFGLSANDVNRLCRRTGDASIAIFNTPRQIIISGLSSSVNKVMEESLLADALDAYPLNVAVAYHSALVLNSGSRLLAVLKDDAFQDPEIPIYSYTTLGESKKNQDLKEIMAFQLSRPVRWVELIQHFRKNGMQLCIEIGPGAVLSRTVRWIDRTIEMMYTDTAKRLDSAVSRCRSFDKSTYDRKANK